MKDIHQPTSQDYSNLIGIPYETMNCWDIVQKFYAQVFGIELKKYYGDGDPDIDWRVRNLIKSSEGDFKKTSHPQFGDILTIKIRGVECHIAIFVGNGLIFHTMRGTGSCLARLERFSKLVVGYYTLRDTAT